jgi:hypothetical protein
LCGQRIELPKIIQTSEVSLFIRSGTAKQPQVTGVVGPGGGIGSCTWMICGGWNLEGSVPTWLAAEIGVEAFEGDAVASTHPCP